MTRRGGCLESVVTILIVGVATPVLLVMTYMDQTQPFGHNTGDLSGATTLLIVLWIGLLAYWIGVAMTAQNRRRRERLGE